MSGGALAGTIVAMLVRGGDDDRAVAVSAAEAGADIAFATVSPGDEFPVASIANEVWSLGRNQFVMALDARDPTAVAAFAARVEDELGPANLLVVSTWLMSSAPFDELSADEWLPVLEANLTLPYIAVEAFGRLMERAGRGAIAIVAPDRVKADAAERAARSGLVSLVESANGAWNSRGVRVRLVTNQVAAIFAAVGQDR
jgi:NAD(P)-dependent dehydrogenase (short-subunit alcohol dehydrogenase family)